MSKGRGIVKEVLSGDTIRIMGLQTSGPPPEKLLNLSSLSAPRVGTRDRRDEPFAWASREYLRRKCVGRQVYFRLDYTHSGREFATVYLQPESNAAGAPPEAGENLGVSVVTEGWAKVRKPLGANETVSPDYEQLVRAEQTAESEQRGLWNKEEGSTADSVRTVHYDSFDAYALVDEMRGKRQHAVVDQVRDGSCVRALLLPSFHMVTVYLAGIQCPNFKPAPATVDENGKEIASANGERIALPFAAEAKHYTEIRVLHRDVGILFQDADKYNNTFGTVFYGEGAGSNLGEDLLTNGLARVVEWSVKKLPSAQSLRAAEQVAKDKRIKLWKDWVPPPVPEVKPGSIEKIPVNEREFNGKVVEVLSGDTLVVLDQTVSPPSERKLSLSSIRAPRPGVRRDQKDEPWAWESKEFLRSLLIGKKVHVLVEFVRSIPTEKDTPLELVCATVTVDGKNAAEAIVEAGLAKVVRHRQDDERSNYYGELTAAEMKAKKLNRAVHNESATAPVHHVNDLTGPEAKDRAKQFLAFLQRKGTLRGLVAFVSNGARFKVYVPSETCLISFVLSGVRCPNAPRRDTGGSGDPFGEEALLFTRQLCMQHEVEIDIETQDRLGSFLGTLYINKKNIAVLLLEAGLGKLHDAFRAERSPTGKDLLRAQEVAQAQKLKLWSLVTDNGVDLEAQNGAVADGSEVLEVTASEVIDGSRFYGRLRTDPSGTWIENQLQALSLHESGSAPISIREGELVVAQFTADDQWYRARVERIFTDADGIPEQYGVTFIDYGNTDAVEPARVRKMDISLSRIPPQAFELVLAGVKVPTVEEDFGIEAAEALKRLIWDRPLSARVFARDGRKRPHVVATDDRGQSINGQLVRTGLARAKNSQDTPVPESVVTALKDDEDAAKKARLSLWQYGDIAFSDDEDEPVSYARKAKGKK